MTDTLDFLLGGFTFACSFGVGWACIWRLNLMRRGVHRKLDQAGYWILGMGAAMSALHVPGACSVLLAGIATIFWSGRERWLTKPPEDVVCNPATLKQVRAALRASMVIDRDVNRAAAERAAIIERARR